MPSKPRESDWKAYRKQVAAWRERHLDQVNQEIVGILTADDKTPTERFWDAKRAMKDRARILEDCFDPHARSKMEWHLILMFLHGIVTDADLNAFSDELRERVLASRGVVGRR